MSTKISIKIIFFNLVYSIENKVNFLS